MILLLQNGFTVLTEGRVKFMGFYSKLSKLLLKESEFSHFTIVSLVHLFFNKQFKSTAGYCLSSIFNW